MDHAEHPARMSEQPGHGREIAPEVVENLRTGARTGAGEGEREPSAHAEAVERSDEPPDERDHVGHRVAGADRRRRAGEDMRSTDGNLHASAVVAERSGGRRPEL
jgi:hypothetical protein